MPSTKFIVLLAVFGAVGTVTAGTVAPGGFVGVSGGADSMNSQSWVASNETTTVEPTTTTADTDPGVNTATVETATVTTDSTVNDSVSNSSRNTTTDTTDIPDATDTTTDTIDTATNTTEPTTNTTDTTTNTTDSTEPTTNTNTTDTTADAANHTSGRTSGDPTTTIDSTNSADSTDSTVDTATRTIDDTLESGRDSTADTLANAPVLAGESRGSVGELVDGMLTVTADASSVSLLDEYEEASVTRRTLLARMADSEPGVVGGSSGVEGTTVVKRAGSLGSGIDAVQWESDQDQGTNAPHRRHGTPPSRDRGRAGVGGLSEPGSDRSEIPVSGWGGPQFRPTATAALTILGVGFACTGATGIVSPVTAWGALTRRATNSLGRPVRSSGVDRFVPLPGYSRYDDSDPLENELRRDIYERVTETPGAHRARLAEQAGVAPATVRYHARVLEREQLVKSEKIGGRQRLYPVGFDDVELAAAMEDDATAGVIATIVDEGPVPVSEIAASVGRCPGTVSYHLDRLEEADLIEREKLGNTIQVRARPSVEAAVRAEDNVPRQ